MRKYLILLVLFGLCLTTHAQILKKLKDKARSITSQKTDAKANQVIGNSVDSVMQLKAPVHLKKQKKKKENEIPGTDSTAVSNPATDSVKSAASLNRSGIKQVCLYQGQVTKDKTMIRDYVLFYIKEIG